MKQKPSDYFCGAILRAYNQEALSGKAVTPSGIWDRVCWECIQKSGAFVEMFAWDTRKAHQNRVGTIRDTIEAGFVPGLKMDLDGRGRMIVVKVGK